MSDTVKALIPTLCVIQVTACHEPLFFCSYSVRKMQSRSSSIWAQLDILLVLTFWFIFHQ